MADEKKVVAAAPKGGGTAGSDLVKPDEEIVGITSVDKLSRAEVDGTVADNKGIVSNRVEGTIQSEPTAEELPSDCRISPVAEQLMPGSKLAVGHLTIGSSGFGLPDSIAVTDERDLTLQSDMSEPELPEGSTQDKKLEIAIAAGKIRGADAVASAEERNRREANA